MIAEEFSLACAGAAAAVKEAEGEFLVGFLGATVGEVPPIFLTLVTNSKSFGLTCGLNVLPLPPFLVSSSIMSYCWPVCCGVPANLMKPLESLFNESASILPVF